MREILAKMRQEQGYTVVQLSEIVGMDNDALRGYMVKMTRGEWVRFEFSGDSSNSAKIYFITEKGINVIK